MMIRDKATAARLEELGFGRRTGKGYHIDAMEGKYLAGKKIISDNSAKKQKVDQATYALYCHFMDRGYQVRVGKDFLRIYERGRRRQSDVPTWLVKTVKIDEPLGGLEKTLKVAKGHRKSLVRAAMGKGCEPKFYSFDYKTF